MIAESGERDEIELVEPQPALEVEPGERGDIDLRARRAELAAEDADAVVRDPARIERRGRTGGGHAGDDDRPAASHELESQLDGGRRARGDQDAVGAATLGEAAHDLLRVVAAGSTT